MKTNWKQKTRNWRPKTGSRTGQAAMEYLMTYGWAILVIVIVLAILAFYLPSLIKPPEGCVFSQPGFTCGTSKPVLSTSPPNNEVALAIRFFNQQQQNIEVKGVLCTTLPASQVEFSMADVTDNVIGSTNRRTIPAGASVEFPVTGLMKCKKSASESLKLTKNSDFRGIFVIWYNFENEVGGASAPKRQAQAVITSTVLER